MAEPLGGIPKSEAAKLGKVVRQVLGRLPDVGRRTRRIYAGGSARNNTTGGTGGGGCCCDELDCLRIDGYSGVITAEWYEFRAPSFRCYCDPAESAGEKVKLYPLVDPDIWETPRIQCLTSADGGTNTANWIWKELDDCGICYWLSHGPGDPWVQLPDAECECGTCSEPTFDPPPGGTVTTSPCTEGGYTPGWNLVSVADPDACMPLEPDFDGTVDGQTAETTCELEDGEPVLADSFWRLTIGTVGYYGCDDSKLEFMIDATVVITYYLTCPNGPGQSRAFCRTCVNTFHVVNCGPTQCDVEPPTVICLKPVIDYLVDGAWPNCTSSDNGEATVLNYFRVQLTRSVPPTGQCVSTLEPAEYLLKYRENPSTSPYIWWEWALTAGQYIGVNICCDGGADLITCYINRMVLWCNTDTGKWTLSLYGRKLSGEVNCDAGTPGDAWLVNVVAATAYPTFDPDFFAGDTIPFPATDMSDTGLPPGGYTGNGSCYGTITPTATPVLPP